MNDEDIRDEELEQELREIFDSAISQRNWVRAQDLVEYLFRENREGSAVILRKELLNAQAEYDPTAPVYVPMFHSEAPTITPEEDDEPEHQNVWPEKID